MIRVLLVDDQPLVRTGLRAILRPEYGFEVAGECGDGVSVADEVDRLQPDVVVMDVRMPGVSGTEATRRLRQRSTGPPVLVLTTYDDDETLSSALRAGAAGFLLKDSPPEDIHRAVKAVAAGEGWLDPAVCGRVLAAYRPGGRAAGHDPGRLAALTPRELDVLRLMARGHPNPGHRPQPRRRRRHHRRNVRRAWERLVWSTSMRGRSKQTYRTTRTTPLAEGGP